MLINNSSIRFRNFILQKVDPGIRKPLPVETRRNLMNWRCRFANFYKIEFGFSSRRKAQLF